MKLAVDAILRPEQAAYLEAFAWTSDPLLAEMEAYAREHDEPISDPEVARFLSIATRLARPRRIVELGTNIGYGAIVLARAAGPDARVVTVERSPKMVEVARGYVARAGLSDRIEIREADALTAFDAIDGCDLVYIDCIKEDYPAYLEAALPKLSAGGVVIADNVLWGGHVAAADADVPAAQVPRVAALRAFNLAIVSDPRLEGVILPLGDGLAYAMRR